MKQVAKRPTLALPLICCKEKPGMRFLIRSHRWLIVSALLAAGCSKMNLDRTVTLEGGQFRAIMIDPQPSNQRITVTVTSSGPPIDVFAIREADENAALKVAEDALRSNKSPPNALDGRPKVTEATFTMSVAAKTSLSILLINGSSKKADVTIKMVGR
jgi:hypothetical protein